MISSTKDCVGSGLNSKTGCVILRLLRLSVRLYRFILTGKIGLRETIYLPITYLLYEAGGSVLSKRTRFLEVLSEWWVDGGKSGEILPIFSPYVYRTFNACEIFTMPAHIFCVKENNNPFSLIIRIIRHKVFILR